MTTTINGEKERLDCSPEIDPTTIISAVFGFILKGARRLVKLNEGELSALKELASMLPKATEKEKIEIIETMLETLFPDENIGGISDPVTKIDSEARSRVESCRQKVGQTIREIRESQGMTQEMLAEKSGLPQSHISRLECGKHTPTDLTIEKISAALNVSPELIDPFPKPDCEDT